MTNLNHISANVRAEIARAGIGVGAVLVRAGMSRTTYNRRLRAPAEWELGELQAIAEVLGIPTSTLVRTDTEAAADAQG